MASEELVGRKGRLRQRYDNEYRLVAGCVPYRVGDDGELQVLMVSTPNRLDFVFPKGGWEDDEDVYQAACREAMEEAGVKGKINRASLGLWVLRSKSSQKSESPSGACKGYIFALEVTEELERWPEQDTHGRRWESPEDAFRLCRYDWMREALTALLDRRMPPPSAASLSQGQSLLLPAPAGDDDRARRRHAQRDAQCGSCC
ncbi:hypothetical protein GUJ93_ZPchr0004g39777 [Zizania palustris]|uniref:Nudix hydrolase domain-containing protein n=1 Tax=Zizania palustris TaxID=103762 RepID=A0A8J5SIH2_ZIZPA|nr:hypothetical protein GUJ93_ZPchr0004g39777 [Zizania palustris]